MWPEQLQTEPSISYSGMSTLPAWPDLIAAGQQNSCGDSGSLSAREQRRPTAAAEPWPDLHSLDSSPRSARGVDRSSADDLPASFGRRASAPAIFGTRSRLLSDEIARFASGLLREEHVERLDSIRDEMRAGERAVPCCDRCGDFTCALARPPPSEVVRLTLAANQVGGIQCLDDLGVRLRRQHGRVAVEWVAGIAAAAGLLVGDILLGLADASPLPRDAPLSVVEAALLAQPGSGIGSGGATAGEAQPAMVPATVPELAAVPMARDGSRAALWAHELADSRPPPSSMTPPSPPSSPPPLPPPSPPPSPPPEPPPLPPPSPPLPLPPSLPPSPPRVLEVHRGPLTCLTCQALPGVDYRVLKAAPLGLTCCAVCGYISLRPLVHGRCPLCQAELGRFLKRQAHQDDARLAGKQSRAMAGATAASAAAASAASLARASSFEGQRARRADEMRRGLQHGMEEVGTWIGGLVEGVKLPGVGARQLAGA